MLGCSIGVFIFVIIQFLMGNLFEWVTLMGLLVAIPVSVLLFFLAEKRILLKVWKQLDTTKKSETVSWKEGRIHYLKVSEEDEHIDNTEYIGETVMEIKYPLKNSEKQLTIFADRFSLDIISMKQ